MTNNKLTATALGCIVIGSIHGGRLILNMPRSALALGRATRQYRGIKLVHVTEDPISCSLHIATLHKLSVRIPQASGL
jgi:hypothetical protein